MTISAPPLGWFYVCSEEAAPILTKIFESGARPGAVMTIPEADFEILQKGVVYLPVHLRDDSVIEKPRLVMPQSS